MVSDCGVRFIFDICLWEVSGMVVGGLAVG
jgi:hypothetical protein